MKKILLISLTLLLIGSFVACKKVSSSQDNSSKATSSTNSTVSSEESSKTNDMFPNTSEITSSAPISSEETSSLEAPAAAQPLIVDGVEFPDLSQYENEKKGWGQGHPVDENNRPLSCDQYQDKYGEYGGLFIMPPTDKTMYLTFDEGYENGYTEKILDALKEKNCPGVFFVTFDYVKKNPELVQRMIDEGHAVGNHSMNHHSMPTLDDKTAIKEISDLHNYMVENFNYQMTLFRPPMGEWSTRTLVIAKELGYKTVFWSYAYADWNANKQIGVDKAYPKVSQAAHSGAIYLLHAVSKDNTEMLPDLIDYFREQGYSLEKLS